MPAIRSHLPFMIPLVVASIAVAAPADALIRAFGQDQDTAAATDRQQVLNDQIRRYRGLNERYLEAAAAQMGAGTDSEDAEADDAMGKMAGFASVLQMLEPMNKITADVWQTYQDGPKDNIALQAVLFLHEASYDAATLRSEILEHFADADAISGMARIHAVPLNFARADEAFLSKLIEKSSSPSVRAAASISLADNLNQMGRFLKDMQRFDSSIEDVLLDLLKKAQQTMAQNFGMDMGGEGGIADMFNDEQILEQMRPMLQMMPLNGWADADPDELLQRARALLADIETGYDDVHIIAAEFNKDGSMRTRPDVAVTEVVAHLVDRIENDIVGKPAMALTATDLSGSATDLESLRGRVVMLDFWATWCPPCVGAMPGNQEMVDHFAGRPFELVTLSVDATVEQAEKFMKQKGYRFTDWYLGPTHEALKRWRVDSYPTYIIIDDQGIVQAIPRTDHESLQRYLDKLITAAEQRRLTRSCGQARQTNARRFRHRHELRTLIHHRGLLPKHLRSSMKGRDHHPRLSPMRVSRTCGRPKTDHRRLITDH